MNFPEFPINEESKIICGDCSEVVKDFPCESIDCIVTSPPYFNLRTYDGELSNRIGSQTTPEEYISVLSDVFASMLRILKKDGVLWLNIGDCFASKNLGNIITKERIGIPWMLAFALRDKGFMLRQDIIWEKPNAMPESVKDRFTCSHEMLFMFVKSKNYHFNPDALREESGRTYKISNNAPKFGGNKYGNSDDPHYNGKSGKQWTPDINGSQKVMRNIRDIWKISVQPFPGCHFATFPQHLVDRCIKCSCIENGTVLDPFCGSGTTALSAIQSGRKFIGIETSEEYCKMAVERIKKKIK